MSVTKPINSSGTSLCWNMPTHRNLLRCSATRKAWPRQTSSCSQYTCGHVTPWLHQWSSLQNIFTTLTCISNTEDRTGRSSNSEITNLQKNRKKDFYAGEYTILKFVIRKHRKPGSNLNPVIAEYTKPYQPLPEHTTQIGLFWQQELRTFEPPLKKEHSNLMIRKLGSFATHLTSTQNAWNSC